ncbi:MAG: glycosyltransferase [Ignavibacteriota bacterium]
MTVPSDSAGKKSVHVFASDFLPFPGCPRTAGGNRSLQVISALRRAGHHVTFSMPLTTHIGRQHIERVRPLLTSDELWACENFFNPDIVVQRFEPDIVVYCNINVFRTVSRFPKDVIHILDLYGPLQFEGLLLDTADHDAAMQDARQLQERCKVLVEKFRDIDYVVTVSERQKYFWSAYCTLAGFSFADLNVLVCPVAFDVPDVERKTAPRMTVVYSGGFYPWQNPENSLRATTKLLERIEGAKLHIFGGPHAGLANEKEVYRLLDELQKSPSVQYHGYRPAEELAETLSTAWCALELMERNIERELAITGRTVEFLSTGTPVIYNDYSSLSSAIQKFHAGWTIPPSRPELLESVFTELAQGGVKLVNQLSANARALAAEEFNPVTSIAPLLDVCQRGARKRTRVSSMSVSAKRPPVSKLLAISADSFAIVALRVQNPLRALQRQGLIGGFTTSGIDLDFLLRDPSRYQAVLVQRVVPEYIYQTLANLGVPFVLDVDDNVLARAVYRRGAGVEKDLLTGLRHATVLTVPNVRLARLLEKYSGLSLAQKTFIAPNALPYPQDLSPRSEPKQIVWIQSDIAAMTTSRDEVVRAVEDFSVRHQLPILLIGRNALERPQFTHQVIMGEIDFHANLQLLEFAPTSIGVAPLETAADEETLDFVAGKSDLKMLLFDGYGHPGVYSAAPPYTDSPLRGCKIVPNSYAEWTEALEYQFREGWRAAAGVSRVIREQRHIDAISRDCWFPAIEAALVDRPVPAADLRQAFCTSREVKSAVSSQIGYLFANPDVADDYVDMSHTVLDHFEKHGRREGRSVKHDPGAPDELFARIASESAELGEQLSGRRAEIAALKGELNAARISANEAARLRQEVAELRNSMSWRITAPIRKLLAPFMRPKA